MAFTTQARGLLAGALLAAALLAPATVLANGTIGEHVKEFENHLDDYAADVAKLDGKLDALADRYAEGKDVAAGVEAFVEAWEAVKYHGAVERVATPLYPPIWQAIGGLRQAVKQGKDPEVVRARAEELTAVLHQGLGGLKLKAQMVESGQARQTATEEHAGGPETAFARIREKLDHALEEYADGHADDAKGHIQDAYFNHFEGLEGGLIEQDPELVAHLEEAFNAGLPSLINDGAPLTEVRAKAKAMKESLARAEQLLAQSDKDHGEVF